MEVHAAAVDNVKDVIMLSVHDADMEIHYPMKRNLIIYQNFKKK